LGEEEEEGENLRVRLTIEKLRLAFKIVPASNEIYCF
jgi:hypothetical protein